VQSSCTKPIRFFATARIDPDMPSLPPPIVAFDLEGVFLPEIWIAFAEQSALPALRRTTRDEPDYNKLMQERMAILRQNNLTLHDIQQAIDKMEPLPGVTDFLGWIRRSAQLVIITDSFYEFVRPFLPKLGWPTVFAHTLEVDPDGMVAGYRLRVPNGKQMAVEAFKKLGFRTAAVGDSYNDTAMLAAADRGIFFRPPDKVIEDFPQFPITRTYDELRAQIEQFLREGRHG
jgi:phosphoserine / homoserine phosphotransferase